MILYILKNIELIKIEITFIKYHVMIIKVQKCGSYKRWNIKSKIRFIWLSKASAI